MTTTIRARTARSLVTRASWAMLKRYQIVYTKDLKFRIFPAMFGFYLKVPCTKGR